MNENILADDWFISLVYEALKDSGREISDPKELTRILKEVITEVLPKSSKLLFKAMKSESSKMLKERRLFKRQFDKNLMKKWKKPINLLEMLLEISYEFGDEFNRRYREKAVKTQDYVFDVLTRLHAKACQVGFEILTLLKSGLADGAHARWRTLHEIAVISFFIEEHGQDVAKRFLHYTAIDNYREARVYQRHCHELGYKPLTNEETLKIKKMRDEVLKIYGRDFSENYGWIPKNILTRRNFAEIEKSVRLARFRQYYMLACYNIHSGPKELRFKFGLISDSPQCEMLLAGPSNYGLADPGQCTAISLSQITTCLLSIKPTFKFLAEMKTMKMLVDEIKKAFCEVQFQIEEEEKIRIMENLDREVERGNKP